MGHTITRAVRAVLYARFSTDKQRDASIEDQFRECERIARALNLEVVKQFSDKGISGGTAARPGYQALLAAARRHEFDLIVVEDISRLWRSRAEFGPRSAEFEDLGVHCVTCVGDDTRRDGWGLVIQIKQAVAEHGRREASYRTRRGLEGRALAGRSTGGRAYGYVAERESASKRIEIAADEAAMVRQIFTWYADGFSPRRIASNLNEQGVPSPGARWRRKERRRDRKWLASAIHGDVTRGTGILNNRRYIGVVLWGRSEWKRSALDSAKRRHRMLEEGSAHEMIDERLRIVSPELWERVKARQVLQSRDTGVKVKVGLRRRSVGGGRPAKYLLSGLLKCGSCGASFILSNGTRYQCASHHQGGSAACSVGLSVPRDRVEHVIRECVNHDLLNPARLAEIDQCYRNAGPVIVVDHAARITELESQIANMTNAIASGLLSEALAARLKAAEGERGRLIATQERLAMEMLSSAAVEQRVQTLREHLEEGGERAHVVLRQLFPTAITLDADSSGRFLWASFRDGMDKALYDQDLTALFPQVENNGSGGRI